MPTEEEVDEMAREVAMRLEALLVVKGEVRPTSRSTNWALPRETIDRLKAAADELTAEGQALGLEY